MDVGAHLDALRADGARLGDAAAVAGLQAPVPTCPDWSVRALLLHIGEVHRWAALHVEGREVPATDDEVAAALGEIPDGDGLVDWYRAGHAQLVAALEAAPADLQAWTFLPAPSPLAFWARRQAHETAIHRVDAEAAAGAVGPVPMDVAADGLAELLEGFAARRRARDIPGPPPTLLVDAVDAVDAGARWRVTMDPERFTITGGDASEAVDCAVRGPAERLYLLLWNRAEVNGLHVDGDASVLDVWRRSVRITWS